MGPKSRSPIVTEFDLASATRIEETAVRQHFANSDALFATHEKRTGAIVDLEMLAYGGAFLLGKPGR